MVDLVYGDGTDFPFPEDRLLDRVTEHQRNGVTLPGLFACCGTEDFLHEDNIRFRDHALALGLDLAYEEEAAGHEWGYWDRKILDALRWMLQSPAGAGTASSSR